jgi:hypothetical protein
MKCGVSERQDKHRNHRNHDLGRTLLHLSLATMIASCDTTRASDYLSFGFPNRMRETKPKSKKVREFLRIIDGVPACKAV